MHWILPAALDEDHCRTLAHSLGVPRFVAEILCRRGFSMPAEATLFLDPKLKTLTDPCLLPGMNAAVDRLLAAVDRGERIVLYGDYDVDGVTSVALFTRVLRAYGADPKTFLPLRMEEGYGLSREGVARCLETLRPQLLVAVDCGTSSVDEIASLREAGVDVLVFDHHEPKGTLPACVALVNPKLGGGMEYLCSVGIVFKAAHAMLKRRPLPDFRLRDCLDLVALGTVADLVPLAGENRTLVKAGLVQLAQTQWPGLHALMEVATVRAPLTPGDVGFKLGPRMNAAGRLSTAESALELLLTADPARARQLALSLDAQNRDRRAVEDSVTKAAEAQLEEWFQPGRDAAIVVGAMGWHPGVVGIVASRIMKRHHRPALVIGFGEDGVGKGSGRSIRGLCMVTALTECGEHLVRYGGHEMAAGLTLQHSSFEAFREAFRACAGRHLSSDHLQPRLHLDAELTLAEVCEELLGQHGSLQPFGMGNPQPLFFSRGITPGAEPRIMKEKHLSLVLRQNRTECRAVWWNAAAHPLPAPPWDVAFELERNEYQGRVTAQLQVRAIRTAASS